MKIISSRYDTESQYAIQERPEALSEQALEIAALKEVLKHLKKNGAVPAAYKPHMLSGKLKGFMECHVEDDFLLIWIDEEANVIKLVRLGTHHELFGK